MLLNMLKRDLRKKKTVSAILFLFVFLSTLLASAGTGLIAELAGAVGGLLAKSAVPHYVQMHSGALDEREIVRWAAENGLVRDHQTVEMVPVDGGHLYFDERDAPELASVMDFYFVRQNGRFDFLLNLEGDAVRVAEGGIAVPVYFREQRKLEVGDRVRIDYPDFVLELVITDFVRDAVMNPSIVHSKRFVVHPADYERLKRHAGAVEYLIEFRLADAGRIGEFHKAYQASGLPAAGPSVDLALFRMLNGLTDGVVAAVTLLVSLLLILIAMLCVRFTLLATLEEDYREIGVLKAIGASRRHIRGMYLMKYAVLAASASVSGCAAAWPVTRLLSADLALYLGKAERGPALALLPPAAAAVLCGLLLLFCLLVLRRFGRVSAVEALRPGGSGGGATNPRRWRLDRSRLPVPVWLGLKRVFQHPRMFGMLAVVFAAGAFLMLVPLHMLNTIQSPGFIAYLGIGRSDIRIDLHYTDRMDERFRRMIETIRQDEDVERFSPLITSRFRLLNGDGKTEPLNVETGDFTIFPLDFVQGRAPLREDEIALSALNARELDRRVGDTVRLLVGGRPKELVVTGIYQDITNGGRTAKAMLPHDPETALWYSISLDLKPHADARAKIAQYAALFEPASVTGLEDYMRETLGQTIGRLRAAGLLAYGAAICLSVLITALFLGLLTARDRPQTAVLRSIGFATRHIRTHYATAALTVLAAGIAAGTVLANTAGQKLAGAVWSLLGAPDIRFVIEPVQAYVVCPLVLAAAVAVTAWLGAGQIRKVNIAEMIRDQGV